MGVIISTKEFYIDECIEGDYVLQGSLLVKYQGNAEEVIIPEDLGITEIGMGAFSMCFSLSSVSLPESLTSIGDEAFSKCRNLNSITLPEGLALIGDRAFFECDILSSIILQPLKPPVLNGSLCEEAPIVIYVPPAALDDYRNAEGWKNHADMIRSAV